MRSVLQTAFYFLLNKKEKRTYAPFSISTAILTACY